MPSRRVITRLTRQQATEQAEVARMVRAARARVAERVREIAARARAATNAAERERLYAQIAKINEALADSIDRWASEMTDRIATDWHKAALDDIRSDGASPARVALRFDRAKVRDYLSLLHPDNSQQLAAVFTRKMSETDIRNLRQAFLDVYRESQLDNLTANELQKAIQRRWNDVAGSIEFERFRDRAGRTWENARYLQMLVRTTTARVARESYIDTLVSNGDDLMQVVNVGDSCPICSAWGGLIVSISGADDRYPSYQRALSSGMFHPGCDCLLRRVDETVHADAMKLQAGVDNPEWDDDAKPKEIAAAVEAYRGNVA